MPRAKRSTSRAKAKGNKRAKTKKETTTPPKPTKRRTRSAKKEPEEPSKDIPTEPKEEEQESVVVEDVTPATTLKTVDMGRSKRSRENEVENEPIPSPKAPEPVLKGRGKRGRMDEEIVHPPKDKEEEEDDDVPYLLQIRRREGNLGRKCPFLDTIRRPLLDFHFRKVCSVTLSDMNVYACLVCGKYFGGRGLGTPAHTHALQSGHAVFMNLHSYKFYELPADYEISDTSLDDIRHVAHPTYTDEEIAQMDQLSSVPSRTLDGEEYHAGRMGLNNLNVTGYVNVVLQALIAVPMLRTYFLREENYAHITKSPLVHRFGELMRFMWNPRSFRHHVSPHELMQTVIQSSSKRFRLDQEGDPAEFMMWLLGEMHRGLGGTKKKNSSIIYKAFQGRLLYRKEVRDKMGADTESHLLGMHESDKSFMVLSLDVPPPPLFKDAMERNVIPQVPLFQLLQKYDGVTPTSDPRTGDRAWYHITRPPKYLIFHVKRFKKNNFFLEKNPTIVTFPVKNLDMTPYIRLPPGVSIKYDLVSNVVHNGQLAQGEYEKEVDKGVFRVHVHHKGLGQFVELEDLQIDPIMPQVVAISESYLQIYKLQSVEKKEK